MKQALHIFAKDARHLRWEIALVLLVTAFAPYAERHVRVSNYSPPIVMLPLAWWFLTGRVIHAEALPGHQQFWLTRPYSRVGLFAGKMMFLAAFTVGPMAISDAVILKLHGFALGDAWPGLFLEQILRWAAFVAPAAALAAITRGMKWYVGGTLLAGLLAVAPIAVPYGQISWGILEWLHGALMIAFAGASAVAILVWQYATRRTWAARIGLTCLVALGSVIPTLPAKDGWALAPRLSSRWWGGSWVSVMLDRSSAPAAAAPEDAMFIEQTVRVSLPLRFIGLPKNLTPRAEQLNPGVGRAATWDIDPGGAVRQVMLFDAEQFAQIKNDVIDVPASAIVTLTRHHRSMTIPVVSGRLEIPGVGRCQFRFLRCESPFRPPELWILPDGRHPVDWISYSPFPAAIGIDPLSSDELSDVTLDPPLPQVTVATEEPVAHFRVDYILRSVRLADFQLPMSPER